MTRSVPGLISKKCVRLLLYHHQRSEDGKWELIRKNDNPKGSFSYVFKKIENNWLIISDYTTDEYYP